MQGKTKLVACRFDMPLYNKINNHTIQNSDLIRQAVIQFLNNGTRENIDVDDEYLYSSVYNELYNMEIAPLKQENKYLTRSLHVLENDKSFLMDEVRALTVMTASKIPLLQKINLYISGDWNPGASSQKKN